MNLYIEELNKNCRYKRVYDRGDFTKLDNGTWICPEVCDYDDGIGLCPSCDDVIARFKESETDYDTLVRSELRKIQRKVSKYQFEKSDFVIDKIDEILGYLGKIK